MQRTRRSTASDAISKALLELGALRAAARATSKRRRTAAARHGRQRGRAIHSIAMLQCLGSNDEEAAACAAVAGMLRQSRASTEQCRAACCWLRETHRARGDQALQDAARNEANRRPATKLLHRLARALAELRVVTWLRAANTAGIAPSRAQLLRCFMSSWPREGRSSRSAKLMLTLKHCPRRSCDWAKSFRRRWGAVWRRLPARAELPRALLQDRALCWSQNGLRFDSVFGLNFMAETGPCLYHF